MTNQQIDILKVMVPSKCLNNKFNKVAVASSTPHLGSRESSTFITNPFLSKLSKLFIIEEVKPTGLKII